MNDNHMTMGSDRRRAITDTRATAPVPMRYAARGNGAKVARVLFDLLDPIPYGCFLAALVFDAVYAQTAVMFWVKSAAWLIAIGLLFAVLPRVIDLVQVWFRGSRPRTVLETSAFWLNLFAIAAAVVNAFVHSRDAYAVMPTGLLLSILTMALLALATVLLALHSSKVEDRP